MHSRLLGELRRGFDKIETPLPASPHCVERGESCGAPLPPVFMRSPALAKCAARRCVPVLAPSVKSLAESPFRDFGLLDIPTWPYSKIRLQTMPRRSFPPVQQK